MRILIADDEADILDLIQFEVESVVAADILLALNGQEAIELLKSNPDIDYVICDFNMPHKNGADVFAFLKSTGSNAKFLLCSARDVSEFAHIEGFKPDVVIQKPKLSQVGVELKKLIEIDKKITFPRSEYVPLSVNVIVKINSLNSDVYIKLSEQKYVKIINKGDVFTHADLEKYLKKDVKNVYINQKDAQNFVQFFEKELTAMMTAKDIKTEAALDLSKSTLESIHNIVNHFGITPEIQCLTENSVNLSLRLISANKDLLGIFKLIQNTDKAFLIEHSISVGYLACFLADLMGWNSESTFFKLVLACQLHDITLGSGQLSRIKELDLRKLGILKELSAEEKSFFNSHPIQAANLSKEFSQLPADVDTMILQHHESSDGTGFPFGLDESKITPLATVVILAHEMFSSVIEEKKSVKEFVSQYPESKKIGKFKKILQALEKSQA